MAQPLHQLAGVGCVERVEKLAVTARRLPAASASSAGHGCEATVAMSPSAYPPQYLQGDGVRG